MSLKASDDHRSGGRVVHAIAASCLIWIGLVQDAGAQSAQRGAVIARTHCVRCHSIDKVSPSPLTIAPPFRELEQRYPVESLEEAMAEGLVTGHPTMPEFRFDVGQVRDFIAFLKTLQK